MGGPWAEEVIEGLELVEHEGDAEEALEADVTGRLESSVGAERDAGSARHGRLGPASGEARRADPLGDRRGVLFRRFEAKCSDVRRYAHGENVSTHM